jgi:hypothetical protein
MSRFVLKYSNIKVPCCYNLMLLKVVFCRLSISKAPLLFSSVLGSVLTSLMSADLSYLPVFKYLTPITKISYALLFYY